MSGNHESERPDSFDLLDLTSALVEKSMVAADLRGEEPRFRLLETMRQYGLEKLKDAGEAEMIRDRHLAYFTALALQTETPNLRTIEIANIDKLKAEHDNLSSALEWSTGWVPFLILCVRIS